MADLDPIRQLQHLLDDPGKVLERISNIQSVIGSLKGREPAPSTSARPETPASPAQESEHSFERLLQMVRDLRAQIEERVRPLALQVLEAEVASLRRRATEEQSALQQCWERIDGSIASCFRCIDETRQSYTELTRLQTCLSEFGVVVDSLPDNACPGSPTEFILSRLEKLRRQGKI